MTVKVENNFEYFKKKLLNNIQKAGQEAFVTELAEIQSNTPVETGNLKRSLTGNSKLNNSILKVSWGTKVIYARKVEFKDKSYIRSTLKRDIVRIGAIFNKYIGESAK
ncbi:HK97 gp10 family phage protein [Clostridium perfringens]|jgi:hypothetical protein|uniref:HK97 gp10 family phage protein n=1 Tax=Clostridium perfringens TaxID=1502 RepID=UPI0032DB3F16